MSWKKKPEDPRDLMAQALRLMAKDLDFIEEAGKARKLEADEALCLVRYSDSLLKFVKDDDGQDAQEKKRLAKMSTAELVAKAEELTKAAREKAQK